MLTETYNKGLEIHIIGISCIKKKINYVLVYNTLGYSKCDWLTANAG